MAPSGSKILGNATIWDKDNELGDRGIVGPQYNSLLYPFDTDDFAQLDYSVDFIELKVVRQNLRMPDDEAAFEFSVSEILLQSVFLDYEFEDSSIFEYEVTEVELKSVFITYDFDDAAEIEFEVSELSLLANGIKLATNDNASVDYEVTELTIEVP